MTDIDIDLPLAIKDVDESVPAILLPDIAPHLAHIATFAKHQGATCDPFYRRWWFVTNVETGGMVAYDITEDAAIRKATEVLSTKTERTMLAAMRRLSKLRPE